MYTVDIYACVYTCVDRQILPSKAKKIFSDTFGVPKCKITSHRINKNPKNEKRGVKTAAKIIKTMKSARADAETPLCVGENVCRIDTQSQIRLYGLSNCAPRAPNATGYSCVLLGYAP
ncbi:MAG: hypothetical protein Q4E17_07415 [Synergistes sp.]|nr:hypothetical protein [Synergistes sp.]